MERIENFFWNLGIKQQESFVIAIFSSSVEDAIKPMNKVKYNKIYKSINNMISSDNDFDIDERDVVPTFVRNKYIRGVMIVECSTPQAKAWLLDTIQRTPLSQNMQINVVDIHELLQQRNTVYFPNCKTLNRIRRSLRAMKTRLKPYFDAGYALFKDIFKKQEEPQQHDASGTNVKVSTTIDIGEQM